MAENQAGDHFDHPTTFSEISDDWRVKRNGRLQNGSSRNLTPGPSFRESGTRSSIDAYNESASSRPDTLRGEDDPRTLQAIAEGRRLYVGNMPYIAQLQDVRDLFQDDYNVEHINMSTDPYTGRNPSYCFVELRTKAQADQAMYELKGRTILGRPVKIGLGVAKPNRRSRREQQEPYIRHRQRPTFDRWTRTDASKHWTGYSEQGRRLWVGGLPRMREHQTVDDEVRNLFRGFEVEAVSKVVIPKAPAFGEAAARNHRYLFVDFGSAEDADSAAKATNGTMAWGVKIRVLPARPPDSGKVGEREVVGSDGLEPQDVALHDFSTLPY